MAKNTKRRSSAQVARDRRRAADLYLKGWLQVDIADELGLDQSTVSRDLKALHQVWLDAALVDFDQIKARELAKIDRLEREYWEAWDRSCRDIETVTEKGKAVRGATQPNQVEKVVRRQGRACDARFLSGILRCIEKRCEILGLNAPVKQDLTSRDKALLPITDLIAALRAADAELGDDQG